MACDRSPMQPTLANHNNNETMKPHYIIFVSFRSFIALDRSFETICPSLQWCIVDFVTSDAFLAQPRLRSGLVCLCLRLDVLVAVSAQLIIAAFVCCHRKPETHILCRQGDMHFAHTMNILCIGSHIESLFNIRVKLKRISYQFCPELTDKQYAIRATHRSINIYFSANSTLNWWQPRADTFS